MSSKSTQGAVWLKTLHQWHWISSALCLVGMLLFALTGITLNHASQIEAKPAVISKKALLPEPLRAELRGIVGAGESKGDNEPPADTPLPQPVREWLSTTLAIDTDEKSVEWSPDEAYVALPKPGGDAWVRIGIADGQVEYELTDRGWISWLNDLHKGRNTGVAWSWFIDIFAGLCLVFCITGLLILKFHAAKRPSTWPIVGLGLVLPALLALLLIH